MVNSIKLSRHACGAHSVHGVFNLEIQVRSEVTATYCDLNGLFTVRDFPYPQLEFIS